MPWHLVFQWFAVVSGSQRVPEGWETPECGWGDAICPLESTTREKQVLGCRCCVVLQGSTLSSGILLKGNLEKEGEFWDSCSMTRAKDGTPWALTRAVTLHRLKRSIRFTHLTGPSLNALNKLQNLDLKSQREGGLNSALLKMVGEEWFTGKVHSKKILQQFWYKRLLVLLKAYKLFVISVPCSLQCQVLESWELPGNETTQCVLRKVSPMQNYGFASDSRRW